MTAEDCSSSFWLRYTNWTTRKVLSPWRQQTRQALRRPQVSFVITLYNAEMDYVWLLHAMTMLMMLRPGMAVSSRWGTVSWTRHTWYTCDGTVPSLHPTSPGTRHTAHPPNFRCSPMPAKCSHIEHLLGSYGRSQWSSGSMHDSSVRGPRFESHHGKIVYSTATHTQPWARAVQIYRTLWDEVSALGLCNNEWQR